MSDGSEDKLPTFGRSPKGMLSATETDVTAKAGDIADQMPGLGDPSGDAIPAQH